MIKITSSLIVSILIWTTIAHPGANVAEEAWKRKVAVQDPERRTVEDCHAELEASGYFKRDVERRLERVNQLRAEKGSQPLTARDIDPMHEAVTLGPRSIHQRRASCVTDPEVTEGPFWVSGELIREDVTQGSLGVKTHLDINVIDVTTCKPIPNIYVELWGANSTGVYTGVVSKGNGAGLSVPDNINNNALRGIQLTSSNGTASFITVAPGHYVGRANHLHTIIHHGATKLDNNTIQGGTISHVGQFYIDQPMLKTIEASSPYNTNKQAWTQNSQDMIFNQGKGGGDNPLLQISLLGSKIEDGIYASIDVGVNPAAKRTPNPVNQWTAKGGVAIKGSPWAGYPWTR